jgi:hypothetical protein
VGGAAQAHERVTEVLDGMGLAYVLTEQPGLGAGWSITIGVGAAQLNLWAADQEVGAAEPMALLVVNATLAVGVPDTDALGRWIAGISGDYLLGNPYVAAATDEASVHLRHTLIADDLRAEDLVATMRMIAVTADQLARQVVERFGGTLAGTPAP